MDGFSICREMKRVFKICWLLNNYRLRTEQKKPARQFYFIDKEFTKNAIIS